MSQIATSSFGHGGRRKLPYAFTEHGVVMATTVLQTEQAIVASRFIIKVSSKRDAKHWPPTARKLPALIDARRLSPLESEARAGLVGKLSNALGRVLDAIADPVAQTTVRDEARALAAEGLASLKEHLRKTGAQNAKTLAEVRNLLAKQLRLVLVAQQYLERGSVEDLLSVLKDLERA